MSELTSYNSERIYWAVEQVEQESGDIDDLHLDDNLFCLKSEADKVIAEKDAEIARLKAIRKVHVEAIESMGAGLQQDEEVILHQKYKRCLDKAEMCKAKYDKEDAMVNGRGASWDYTSEEMKYWERWSKRWMELAEKLKEAE